jgi:hypothetical protein
VRIHRQRLSSYDTETGSHFWRTAQYYAAKSPSNSGSNPMANPEHETGYCRIEGLTHGDA